ncbi:sigma-54-dependent transcriptional regulator [Candidatus Nitrospira nitrificans]|uniref:Acetoacetate metabolism regulatory protein AtoC n=1 Tax=Candidatus Nitrospira nitrificans TaxID=1742973 RepID=A0A0S4L7X0_9BACT|nr:sigma-54 dependent transcriptional regulator [Candidatus Nitrospira nitrificans]CUS32701.1 Acetoacetate metabolism regulatory protein AtoC [Candidatus Nitrospira nitrificans]
MQARILIVDDDHDILTALKKRLIWMGHEVLTAEDGEQGLRLAAEEQPDLMLLDIELPGLSGLDVLKQLGEKRSGTPPQTVPEVIVITAFGTIDRAVEAIRLGACDFLTKPFEPDHLSVVIEKAMAQMALTRQIGLLQAEVGGRYEHVVGQSPRMVELLDTARRAAGSSATVLLLGETGTGKEVMARALHRWSPRASKPFVVVNCGAFPESLLENELFGHEKGAYTGAVKREPGKIEAAEGGTVFLDEIGDMPAGLQTRLLRLLQDQEFYRLGGAQPIRTDVRFVAATNKDLKEAIQDGLFREDLFYRLNVISLTLPPLRQRVDDLPLLVEYFVRRHGATMGRRSFVVSQDALDLICEYHWPGNVRELENVLIRAVTLCEGDCIEPQHLGIAIRRKLPVETNLSEENNLSYHAVMELYSRKVIEEALRRTGGNQTKAAELLGLQRTYLTRLMKQRGVTMKPPAA